MNIEFDISQAVNYIAGRFTAGSQEIEVTLADYESESDFQFFKPGLDFSGYNTALSKFAERCKKEKWNINKVVVTKQEFEDFAHRFQRHAGMDNRITFLLERLGSSDKSPYLQAFGLSPFVVRGATASPFAAKKSFVESVVFTS